MKAKDFLKKYEGFTPIALWDVNAYRIGYGSDTITDENNNVSKVMPGDRITILDAERDLQRRIEKEFIPRIKKQIGLSNWERLGSNTKTAVISLSYNYGSITKQSILKALKENSNNLAQIWIEATQNDNKSQPIGVQNALKKRRKEEAKLIEEDFKKKSLYP